MKFAAKLRWAMLAEGKNAQTLSDASTGQISARRIGELADAQSFPKPFEVLILSKILNVPIEWLSDKSNKPPQAIIKYCKKNNLLTASYKGELSDDMLLHLADLLHHKENQ